MFADGWLGVGLLLQRLLAGGALAGVLLIAGPTAGQFRPRPDSACSGLVSPFGKQQTT